MSTEPEGLLTVVGHDEQRETIFGQNVEAVRGAQDFLLGFAMSMVKDFGPNVVGSAFLGACANFLLAFYTPESVQEILEGVIPNLKPMHDDIVAAYLQTNTAGSA